MLELTGRSSYTAVTINSFLCSIISGFPMGSEFPKIVLARDELIATLLLSGSGFSLFPFLIFNENILKKSLSVLIRFVIAYGVFILTIYV